VPKSAILLSLSSLWISDGVPKIIYTFEGRTRHYHPDIYIKSQNKLIEVKSTYTISQDKKRNVAKWVTAYKLYNFELRVYNEKGRLVSKKNLDKK